MSQRQQRRRERRRRQVQRQRPGGRQLAAGAGIAMGATLAAGGTAQAADFTVTNLGSGGPGSLAQAIGDANITPGDDRILFQAGLSGAITAPPGTFQVTDGVEILGPGAGAITLSGNGNRVFYIETGDAVTISGLTIAGGNTPEDGAGIFSGGVATSPQLTIRDAVLSGNTSGADGGAIHVNRGSLLVESSTFSGNTADRGAGIFLGYGGVDLATIRDSTFTGGQASYSGALQTEADSPLTVEGSTMSGNTASGGDGAMFIRYPGQVRIANTTIAGNVGTQAGGAIGLDSGTGQLTITASTISGNEAGDGGGIFQYNDPVDAGVLLRNTIVAGNTAVSQGPDLSGPFDAAFSLIGDTAGAMVTETVPGSNILNQPAQLGPLEANGGPTRTMAPAPTSPAVDRGSAFGLGGDQRGVLRPIDFPSIPNSGAAGADGSDIGAFELQPRRAITLGKLRRNRRRGTAALIVRVPAPAAGRVTLFGKGLKRTSRRVGARARVMLKVIPRGAKRRRLRRGGRVRVRINVRYAPTGNSPVTRRRNARLVRRR